MKLQLDDGREVDVHWRHGRRIHRFKALPFGGYTECVLTVNGRGGVGFALCSKRDHFSRSIGRKISLQRALKGIELEKRVRTSIWKAYDLAIGLITGHKGLVFGSGNGHGEETEAD